MRMQATRLAAGKSLVQLSQETRLSVQELSDLEVFDDLFTAIDLSSLLKVAAALEVSPRKLLNQEGASKKHIPFEALAKLIGEYISRESISKCIFEHRAGWKVGEFLADPRTGFTWSVDGLRDICNLLGVDWVSALPDEGQED